MRSILVTGSLAFDYIMDFGDYFSNHIIPDKIDRLNVSFTAHKMTRNFGGTAGNIAYTLALLKERPTIFSTVGKDFFEYKKYLDGHGVDTSEIVALDDELTASAHIITDKASNQITAFYGGAMLKNKIPIAPVINKHKPKLAIIAASGRDGMLLHAQELKSLGVPYIYDPGQSLPSCDGKQLLDLASGAFLIALNDYEESLFQEKTGLSSEKFHVLAKYVVVTYGDKGSLLYHDKEKITIPAVLAPKVEDPTGAGDAFRGGLIKGLLYDLPIVTCCRIASLSGCYAVEDHGTQSHFFKFEDFKRRYKENFGEELKV